MRKHIKNVKVHIWFVLNSAVLLSIYLFPEFLNTPLYVAFIVFGLLVKREEEIKKDYLSKVSWLLIALSVVICSALIYFAFSEYTKKLNESFGAESIRTIILLFEALLISIYFFLLQERRDYKET